MFIFFLIVGLIFLISGGFGLFYTNTSVVSGTALWVFGNITFGTFVVFGVAILIFMAIYNAEFD
jgi:hypothetical protein